MPIRAKQKKIRQIIRNHNNKKETHNRVIQFVTQNGGLDYATLKMEEYKTNALNILNEFPDNEAKTSLIELVEYTVTRKK